MALFIEFLRLVLLALLGCYPDSAIGLLDRDVGNMSESSFTLHLAGVSSQVTDSMTLMENILSILAISSDYVPLQLRLIYDDYYEDAYRCLGQIPKGLMGTTINSYNKTDTTQLGRMVTRVHGEVLVVVLCSPGRIMHIFKMIKRMKLRTTDVIWLLVLSDSEEAGWLAKGLESLVVEGTTIVLLTLMSSTTFRLSVSTADLEGKLNFQFLGTIYFSRNLADDKKRRSLIRHVLLRRDNQVLYADMKGRQLKVTAKFQPLFGYIESNSVGSGELRYGGMEFSLLNVLAEKLNFTYVMVKNVDNGWGDLHPDGRADGVVGMVYRRDVDMAISHVSLKRSRAKAMDFTYPFFLDTIGILTRAPAVKNPTFIAFSPFQPEVWICIITATLTMGPIIKLVSKVTEICLHYLSLGNLQMVSFNIFRSTVIQGNLLQVNSWSQRIIFFFWYTFCLIISALYSGTLVAVLAIPSYEKPVDSLSDLPRAVQEGFIVGTLRQSLIEFLFKSAKEGIYHETWKQFNHDDLSKSLVNAEDVYELVSDSKFAYIVPQAVQEAATTKLGLSKYHFSKETFFPMWVPLACTRGAPFRENIDKFISWMVEAGLIVKWKNDEIRKLRRFEISDGKSGSWAIKLIYLQAAFYLLLLGILVATTVFILETTYRWLPGHKRSRN